MDFEARVNLGGGVFIHLPRIIPMHQRPEGVILLKWVALATKHHPAHLPAEGVDHWVAFALAVKI